MSGNNSSTERMENINQQANTTTKENRSNQSGSKTEIGRKFLFGFLHFFWTAFVTYVPMFPVFGPFVVNGVNKCRTTLGDLLKDVWEEGIFAAGQKRIYLPIVVEHLDSYDSLDSSATEDKDQFLRLALHFSVLFPSRKELVVKFLDYGKKVLKIVCSFTISQFVLNSLENGLQYAGKIVDSAFMIQHRFIRRVRRNCRSLRNLEMTSGRKSKSNSLLKGLPKASGKESLKRHRNPSPKIPLNEIEGISERVVSPPKSKKKISFGTTAVISRDDLESNGSATAYLGTQLLMAGVPTDLSSESSHNIYHDTDTTDLTSDIFQNGCNDSPMETATNSVSIKNSIEEGDRSLTSVSEEENSMVGEESNPEEPNVVKAKNPSTARLRKWFQKR